ncbi:predicted protein [Arabidopsis lyrata subsp. lyrata]|uniref:Predicted protein n=1 Tax=Arabidopsis lyrata subsp. lyrata TaxID=81972 RepID=D7M2D0_ARALL|nr:predicted protein [Arabidopsis lyrata subsp. lyrata]
MRYCGSGMPSMEEGCEFEISYRMDPTSLRIMSTCILEDIRYKAIVVAKPPKNPKSRRSVLCVRLLKDDFSTPLNDHTFKVLRRPIPPTHSLDCIPIKIGCIVEADYKYAWVTGFVVKEIDDYKCLVCFYSPPDIIHFERKLLRPYLEWLGERRDPGWFGTSRRNEKFLRLLAEEPMFSPGTMVEVSSKINETEVVWLPAMSLSCKSSKSEPNRIVDFRSLRPTPPSISVDEYQSEEYVEVFHDGMGWRQGRVMGTLSQKLFTVLLEATKKELAFKHSDLRPLKLWENGIWKMLQTRESPLTQKSGYKMSDSVMNANESDPPVTPPPGITITPLKQEEVETQRKTFPKKTLPRNQNGSGNDSTRENENIEDVNRKRKREENLCSVASAEEDKAKDTRMVLPFEKKLRIWKTLESMEVFKTVPQSPHFSPLVESREDSREISAVGMMLTFSGLLDEVKALQHDDPISSFDSLNDSFSKLEKHGLNVKVPQLRLNKLLSLRDRQSKKTEELKGAEKVTAEKESVKAENERKILELQRLNEEMDKEIAQSKSCATKIVQQLDDVKLEFKATASAPW